LIRTWVRPSSCSTRWAPATIEFAVGDVGRDGDRAVAEVMGQRLDAVGAAGQQRDAVAVVHHAPSTIIGERAADFVSGDRG
jgi:hypothetical protein